jgi:hypothetical protein
MFGNSRRERAGEKRKSRSIRKEHWAEDCSTFIIPSSRINPEKPRL